jgi:hypothetical protein
VDVGDVADVSAVPAASIFSVEVCRVGFCVYIDLCLKKPRGEVGGRLATRPAQYGLFLLSRLVFGNINIARFMCVTIDGLWIDERIY